MNDHERLIQRFYTAFQSKDYRTMQEAYHPEATFSDPVFPDLSAPEVKAMWEMLLTSAKDLKVSFSGISADGQKGHCRWEAWYTFSRTNRPVHNIIHATFEFRDGKIYRHQDSFSMWRWSRQALGISGLLLGWSTLVKNKVQQTAEKGLNKFMKK